MTGMPALNRIIYDTFTQKRKANYSLGNTTKGVRSSNTGATSTLTTEMKRHKSSYYIGNGLIERLLTHLSRHLEYYEVVSANTIFPRSPIR